MKIDPRVTARQILNGGDGHAHMGTTVIIDPRALVRDSLLFSMTACDPSANYVAVPTVEAWLQSEHARDVTLVLYCCLAAHPDPAPVQIEALTAYLRNRSPDAVVAVLAAGDSAAEATEVIRLGARGYLSLSSSLDVTIHALKLIRAGGVYVPASLLGPARQAAAAAPDPGLLSLFSPRELEVARALRKGQPNKVIALELGMSESTVKVHVRNIIKKLKVKNRTEVAFRTQGLFVDNG